MPPRRTPVQFGCSLGWLLLGWPPPAFRGCHLGYRLSSRRFRLRRGGPICTAFSAQPRLQQLPDPAHLLRVAVAERIVLRLPLRDERKRLLPREIDVDTEADVHVHALGGWAVAARHRQAQYIGVVWYGRLCFSLSLPV